MIKLCICIKNSMNVYLDIINLYKIFYKGKIVFMYKMY